VDSAHKEKQIRHLSGETPATGVKKGKENPRAEQSETRNVNDVNCTEERGFHSEQVAPLAGNDQDEIVYRVTKQFDPGFLIWRLLGWWDQNCEGNQPSSLLLSAIQPDPLVFFEVAKDKRTSLFKALSKKMRPEPQSLRRRSEAQKAISLFSRKKSSSATCDESSSALNLLLGNGGALDRLYGLSSTARKHIEGSKISFLSSALCGPELDDAMAFFSTIETSEETPENMGCSTKADQLLRRHFSSRNYKQADYWIAKLMDEVATSRISKTDTWVQCAICSKWRTVPGEVDGDALPDEWDCKMRFWDPANAFCDAPEESWNSDETKVVDWEKPKDTLIIKGGFYDCFCASNKVWYQGKIIDLKIENGNIIAVKVHFNGWKSKFDEWLENSPKYITPLHSYSKSTKKSQALLQKMRQMEAAHRAST